MRAPEFWHHSPGIVAGLLAPVSAAWSTVASLRRAVASPYRAAVPVVCVGNLVAGGSGKTPIVLSLAALFATRGVAVHVVSRGYGGRLAGPVRVVPEIHDAGAVGDEALLLADRVPCWVARDRAGGLRAAVAAGAELVVLDDGFQNPTVAKDLSLLAVDAGYGFGNSRVIPAGPLREAVETGLARADVVVLIGEEPAPAALLGFDRPILRATLEPVDGERFKGRRVVAFAGIGRPGKFFATLDRCGAALALTRPFPDHHPYSAPEIADLHREAERADATLVTTAKDWVRLPPALRETIEVLAVELRWQHKAALDRVLERFLGPAARNEHDASAALG
jgi:tetraacyldisaccharide 4'-kinase